jgi:DNA-binding transcriptional LysR family regulator
MDLDLRKLRYFVAVAERLHFARAAEALYISQPALSRQIRQLELEIGAELLVRSSRKVALTVAGEQLAAEGARLLAESQSVVDATRRAGSGDRSLIVGFMLGTDINPALRAFGDRYPEVEIQLKRLRWWNLTQAVLEGSVDVAFIRQPIPTQGLTLMPLYAEALCVTLPVNHPLAAKASVGIADVADEPVLLYGDATATWNAFWTMDPRPDGSHPRPGPPVHDMEEIIQYVRAGRGVVFLPTAIAAAFPRRDIAYVPITDVPMGQVILAWSNDTRSNFAIALAEAAKATLSESRDA